MKIEVKNIKMNVMFSEETNCFKGDLFIDGKKRGYCENDGHGGCTFYSHWNFEDKEVIKECEKYCKTLPKVHYSNMEWEQTLEGVIDGIIDEHVNNKEKVRFKKKMEKDMLTKLVLGQGNENQYKTVGWKNVKISTMVNDPIWKQTLIDTIKKYKEQGFTILNTNIPKELIELM